MEQMRHFPSNKPGEAAPLSRRLDQIARGGCLLVPPSLEGMKGEATPDPVSLFLAPSPTASMVTAMSGVSSLIGSVALLSTLLGSFGPGMAG